MLSANGLKLYTDRIELLWVSERGTVCLNVALFLCCNSVLTQSQRLTTFVCSEKRFRQISTSIDVSVVSASCFDWLLVGVLGVRWIRSQQRHLYTRFLHHVSTTATPYWQVHHKVTTDKLQRVLNAAARVLTGIPTSSTGVCRGCCTPSCTGSTYLGESCVRSEASCSAVITVELLPVGGLLCGITAATSFSQSTFLTPGVTSRSKGGFRGGGQGDHAPKMPNIVQHVTETTQSRCA